MEGFDFQVGFESFNRQLIERYCDWGKPIDVMYMVPDLRVIVRWNYLTRRELPALLDLGSIGSGYCLWRECLNWEQGE
jgi:hypothetical protein